MKTYLKLVRVDRFGNVKPLSNFGMMTHAPVGEWAKRDPREQGYFSLVCSSDHPKKKELLEGALVLTLGRLMFPYDVCVAEVKARSVKQRPYPFFLKSHGHGQRKDLTREKQERAYLPSEELYPSDYPSCSSFKILKLMKWSEFI